MKILISLYVIFALVLFIYLLLPGYSFPNPPPGAVQSMEQADTETPLRRAYFTDFTRTEVVDYYQNQMSRSSFFSLPMPTLLLNYPPEDAQTLIRDQTRSVYLQEIVHPLRESVYVNGFIPKTAKDDIWYKGIHYQEKITIRFVPGSRVPRLIIGSFIIFSVALIYFETRNLTKYD
jgi:hypothetical protein